MVSLFAAFLKLLVAGVVFLGLPVAVIWLFARIIRLLGWILRGVGHGVGFLGGRIGTFLRSTVSDTVAAAGGILTAAVVLPLALLNLAIGRWPSARHYGRALEDELTSAALSLYQVVLGNPVRLIGLNALTDGIERRLPDVVAHAPRKRAAKPGQFEGYKLVGDLPTGGSGARLFLAEPSPEKAADLDAAGHVVPSRVVIKSFALASGSTLPQIVRESRALEAAKRLGLVLEHELDEDRFHYVMPYVAGRDLDATIRRMHAKAGPEGLRIRDFDTVLAYMGDLLETLERFHDGGLWHKDIKPNNLIVSDDRMHLVDLGLVTPLQSAMTLTTHGTEFYRDPEMVRLAMEGVKVHEVDGVKFDVYSAGAVLFHMIENSFPAHGSLSPITKRCPEALQWIVRKSMADMGRRYGSAREMLADLSKLTAAANPFDVKPANLPSMQGAAPEDFARRPAPPFPAFPARPASATTRSGSRSRTSGRRRVRRTVAVAAGVGLLALAAIDDRHDQTRAAHVYMDDVHRMLGAQARIAAAASLEPAALPRSREPAAPDPTARMRKVWTHKLEQELVRTPRGGACLVLDDLGLPHPGVLEGLGQALEDRGLQVSGLGDGLDPVDIELAAGARSAVGLGQLDDREAVLRLEDFIDATPGLDAVLWLAGDRGDHDSGRFVYRVIEGRDRAVAAPSPIEF